MALSRFSSSEALNKSCREQMSKAYHVVLKHIFALGGEVFRKGEI
jgi:hypothetical protein